MITQSLEETLSQVFVRAKERHHEFITIEHLLLGLLKNAEASKILSACGANLKRLQATLDIFIEETTPRYASLVEQGAKPTQSFQRVLQRAIDQVRNLGVGDVTGVSLLVSLFGEPESQAIYFINQENVVLSDVMSCLTKGVVQLAQPAFKLHESGPAFEFSPAKKKDKAGEMIEQFAENLNEKAKKNKIDPVIGRAKELKRCAQILCRRRKNNPIFVGEAGVGKTAIAEGLAYNIVHDNVPDPLKDATIYTLDMASLLAGTKYRGDFEKRFKSVLNALSKENNAIVFIDEIHTLVGAGVATGGVMDAANLLKPLLSSGELCCMGATTYEEYRQHIEKDNALMRRFQKIDVAEPSEEEAIEILLGLREHFEKHHNLIYTEAAVRRAVELSARYIPSRQLPDKAIDVLDEAGAKQQLKNNDTRQHVIGVSEVESIVAKMARLPLEKITSGARDRLSGMAGRLKSRVFGQDRAIEAVCNAMTLSQSGLRDPEKPLGSFLFSGPTGVGKTEVVKRLADDLDVELIRFDMSEYMESHTVSRLIGAPPGYVGHDQAGLLTEAIIKQPHAVVLLDEIEKAHPDIFNILLQVMDYGFLTDNNGRKADFRHVMLILTSNVGAEVYERTCIGFTASEATGQDSMAAIKKLFTPEFRNRLDGMITFEPLSESVMLQVVENNLRDLRERVEAQGSKLWVSDEAKAWLAEKGYDRAMGARPMARLVKEQLMLPLANALLFGDVEGSEILVEVVDNALHFSYEVVACE